MRTVGWIVALGMAMSAHADAPKLGSSDTARRVPAWPDAGAPLSPPDVVFPQGFGRHVVFVNAGHGAPQNSGSLSVTCTWEMDHNRWIQNELAEWLEATGHFTVVRGRPTAERSGYGARLAALDSSGAEVMIEIHADVREGGEVWEPVPGQECVRNEGDAGFSVLVNDTATGALMAGRFGLARTVARDLRRTGFLDYDGEDYTGNYVADEESGVWLDRRGLMMLRRPTVPSIIIETHNHQNPDEVDRWGDRRVREAFYASVTKSLVTLLGPDAQ